MKKRLLLLALLMGTLTAHAVDYPYLTFVLTDGSKASVSVASDVALTFSGQTLTIGTEKEFTLTNLSQMYFSTTDETQGATGISETLQKACEESGLSRRDAMRAALEVEEMAVYASNKKNQHAYMDILARIYKGNVEIDFRSLGAFFDPFEDADSDMLENVRMLRSIASSIENEYMLGMNATRITIEGTNTRPH